MITNDNGTIEHVRNSVTLPVNGGSFWLATAPDGTTQTFGFYSNAMRWLEEKENGND